MLWIALTNSLYRFFLFLGESIVFWNHWKLWKLRWLLFSHYLFCDLWMPKREGDFVYGETPFWTASQLYQWAEIKPEHTVWDLGCGRGSFLFFGAINLNLSTVGIDFFKLYPEIGKLISRKLALKKMMWITSDFLNLDFSALPSPNLVYIAGTTFSETTLETLIQKLESLPHGAKIISLSSALVSHQFKLLDTKKFWFSWGKASAYLHIKQ